MSHLIEDVSEETEITNKQKQKTNQQMEFLEFKSTRTKIKNSLKGPNRKPEGKKELANLQTDQQMMPSEEQREKRMKRNQQSLTKMWDITQ